MEPTSPNLRAAREDMDRLSLAILRLLNARGQCALGIRRLKDEQGLTVRDARREAQLIDWLVSHNEGPFDDRSVQLVFRAIIDASVSLMEQDDAPLGPTLALLSTP